MTIGYTSSMWIQHIKLSRSFVVTIPFAKWWQFLVLPTMSLDWWAIYRADKNSSWLQQGLKLNHQSNTFFKKHILKCFKIAQNSVHIWTEELSDFRKSIVGQ